MLLRIISAEWQLFSGVVDKITLPTEKGLIWILPWHMNIVSPLVKWIVSYVPQETLGLLESFSDRTCSLSVDWGLLLVENDVITVAAD